MKTEIIKQIRATANEGEDGMKKFLLPEKGNFYKANLHCHTVVSDGLWTPEEVKENYMARGYSVVAYTDHEVLIPHNDLTDERFVALNGVEMEVFENFVPARNHKVFHMGVIALRPDCVTQPCYHRTRFVPDYVGKHRKDVVFDDTLPDFEREYSKQGVNAMMKEAREKGFFVIYNHPMWSLENYADYSEYYHMHALEICNYSNMYSGYKDHNEKEYDDLLRLGRRISCVGGDDNHNGNPDSFGCFTMIKAEKLEYTAITDALLKGNCYASEGPEIYNLWYEDNKVYVQCSPAAQILFNTGQRHVGRVPNAREGCFELMENDIYVRVTIVDEHGRCAMSNAYFLDEIRKAE